jgi:tetratricopeptide (TPR) repeat protein
MLLDVVKIYDETALLERLTTGIKKSGESAVFLVGSALTAPLKDCAVGVPNVAGVIELIKNEFSPDQMVAFEKEVNSDPQPYQSAFSFLIGRRGQTAANNVVKRAVAMARLTSPANVANLGDEDCANLDQGIENWSLTPGVKALGQLIASRPEEFGKTILTTNFDPLLEVSIRSAGGLSYRTVLHREGNLSQTHSSGCHVVHLHGYWHGADTLHTTRQLNQARPRLKASIKSLIESKILVVVGYGGWDDTFMEALREIIVDDNAHPEIIWTLNSRRPQPDQHLLEKLAPGIDRGRVSFYSGIDCHSFFPALLEKWIGEAVRENEREAAKSTRGEYPEKQNLGNEQGDNHFKHEEDRPPLTEFCVGREKELGQLMNMSQRACFITGFGGQGKSTIASRYFSIAQENRSFDSYVWRDCKEEAERFEKQIIDIIVDLSGGHSSANYLAQQSMETLAELFAKLSGKRKILFVFDNVDHYVDLEHNKLAGNAASFLEAYLTFPTNSKLIFTCRPDIKYQDTNVVTFSVFGLDILATAELFEKRGVSRPVAEIEEVHELTSGHAFWLDLIAAQVAKKPAISFREILDQLAQRRGSVPSSILAALQSIWKTLEEGQKIVLQTMAETVRPETDQKLGDYLSGRMRFNRVARALRNLRSLNLVVVKPRARSDDLFDLHPLVREFIRQTFPLKDRIGFIDSIIAVYLRFMKTYLGDVSARPVRDLQYWTENAELLIEAEKYTDAVACLSDVAGALYSSDSPGEFSRVASILFRKIDWNERDQYPSFDRVFGNHFRILVNLGREAEYRELIERYSKTIPAKDARFIHYCSLRSHMHWTRSEFSEAVSWAKKGKELKDKTNVDTKWTAEHELALALRDAGSPEQAIKLFLGGAELNKLLDPDEFDEEKGESFYGNIGRCLHLMGEIDPALICYRKSALVLQKALRPHVENQAFLRTWIGELLIAKGELCPAKTFLEAAAQKWRLVSPIRENAVRQRLVEIENQTCDCPPMSSFEAERYVVAWINEREKYFVGLPDSSEEA